ncbi:MAG: hypothetical protein R2745_12695 [Vicinamibacterales bacterium]
MTPSPMVLAFVLSMALDAQPDTRPSQMPELASMALLSVALAGVSLAVRRAGAKPPKDPDGEASKDQGPPSDPPAAR